MKALLPRASFLRSSLRGSVLWHLSPRYSSSSPNTRNRIFEPARSLNALQTALTLSTTSQRALITLFTLSTNSPVNSRVRSLILDLLEKEAVGELQGGVGYTEVEVDAPDCLRRDVQGMYLVGLVERKDSLADKLVVEDTASADPVFEITSVPTLMAFRRGEPQQLTKLTDIAELQDREFLSLWIRNEAQRGKSGIAGGRGFFEGLFNLVKEP